MQHERQLRFPTTEQRIAWDILRQSPAVRMLESVGAPSWLQTRAFGARPETPERHDSYFHRRSDEERRAARKAGSGAARKAHEELAELYRQVAEALTNPRRDRPKALQ